MYAASNRAVRIVKIKETPNMKKSRLWRSISLSSLLAILASSSLATTVVIYAAADLAVVRPLIADFEQARPGVHG